MRFAWAVVSAFIGAVGVLAAAQFAIQIADHRTVDLPVIAYFIGWTAGALAAEMFLVTGALLVILAVASVIVRKKAPLWLAVYLPFGLGFFGAITICLWLIADGTADYNRVSTSDRRFATWLGIGLLIILVALGPKLLNRERKGE